jgi:putative ABC transport system permease protein
VDRLLASPSLFGSDYEVVLFPGDVEPEAAFDDIDLDDPRIESAAISRGAQLHVAGDLVEAQVIEPVRGVAGGTALRGRAPVADDEVVLGPTTVDRLGLSVGEEVTIAGARRRSMRIVGEAVLPLEGQGAYGDVMWLTPAAAERLEVELQEPRLLVKLAEGITQRDFAATIGDNSDLAVRVPDNVSNLDSVGQIPDALAIFGLLLSAAVLAFALVGIVRRRGRDLAILRTLGLRPRQITASMLTASLLIVGPGAAIGVAIGVVLGRGYWSSVAAGVPAVAQPVVPLATAAVVVLGALVIGCLLAVGPARLATRVQPARILQRD